MNKRTRIFCLLFASAISLVFTNTASAAIFSVTLDKDKFAVGDSFSALIKIDTEDVGVNAGQSTVTYPGDILEVQSVEKTSSVFNFWLEDPSFNNTTGRVSFVGGSSSGLNGRSLQVLKINFKIKGTGNANISFTDTVITASDGSGTSLSTTAKGVTLLASGKAENVVIESTQTPPPPVQIERPAVTSAKLPAKPIVVSAFYPNTESWSNASSNFIPHWELPADVSAVATAINKQPAFQPTTSEGLFDNKTFKALEDGTWYLHVRFKNNVGWGQTEHYKISIDTVPPVPFEINSNNGVSTRVPNPTIAFSTSDQPSGVDYYAVSIDRGTKATTTEETFTLRVLPPGKHLVVVEAHDKAGNITESKPLEIEILPIESPSINPVSKETYIGEGSLQFSGNSIPETKIEVTVKNEKEEVVARTEGSVQSSGVWNIAVDALFKAGKYTAEAVAIDNRGARSLPVSADGINLRVRPLFVFAGLEITATALSIILLLMLISGFFAGWVSSKKSKERRSNLAVIAQRDITTVFNLLEKDVEKMLHNYEDDKITLEEEKEIEYYLNRIKENMSKMKVYLKQNVDEIKE